MSNDITMMRLASGSHITREKGVCLLEAVAWLAGEPHSDRPACTSLVLSTYGRALNDAILPDRDDLEPRLRALAPRLVGTAGRPDLDQLAGLIAADWLIRVYTPAWLRLAGLTEHADALAGGNPIRSWADLPTTDLAAARDAARSAANSAAWSAAWSAAESAVESAADRNATGDAADSAAWGAAGGAAWGAAGNAALSAAYNAIKSAAWSAAWSAACSAARSAAKGAAESAARDALAPTVRELQDSALDLYERMVALWLDDLR
jgi:hypothetical protein